MELVPTLEAIPKAKKPWISPVKVIHQGLRKVGRVCVRSFQGTELLLPMAAVRLLHRPEAVVLPLHVEAPPAMANAVDDGPQRQVASMGSERSGWPPACW